MTKTLKATPVTGRQFQALKARCADGWLRSEFCTQKLKIDRVTGYRWDLVLLETINDYSTDSGTGEPIWQAGSPWNPHQMWCLLKVKRWMSQSPKPTLDDLRMHLTNNQHLYNHAQFFKEYFNHDAKTTRKKP